MISPQFSLDLNPEIIVDNFAGGGGASFGIEQALGRPVDIAVNHDKEAVALHSANHPQTAHFCEDVFKVDPIVVTGGRPVGAAWFSPDCKDFSKAKGGKPRSKKIRGLAWVVVKWAKLKRPRVIFLENVEEFQDWGPLLRNPKHAKDCVCSEPCGKRDPLRTGRTFKYWVRRLRNLGYQVEWRELRACDYGAPTIRRRLFLIARCDSKPIVWPKPTHGDPTAPGFKESGLLPWNTAGDCIDFSIPCYSIFLTREEVKALKLDIKRPLAEATMRRTARGVIKFVIEAKEPFLISYTHQGGDRVEPVSKPVKVITAAHRGEKGFVDVKLAPFITDTVNGSSPRSFDAQEPLRTQCAEVKNGHFAMVSALLAKHYTGVDGSDLRKPIGTITSVDHHSLTAVHLQRAFGQSIGAAAAKPMPTVMPGGKGKTALVASHVTKFYGTNVGQSNGEPLHSITAQGQHLAEVRAFLIKYYGNEKDGVSLSEPIHTIPCVDRFGLVMVKGQPYAIVDILMRMLTARELYRGQGFPDHYVIDIEIDAVNKRGKAVRKRLTGEAQVRMCGNSVCPPMARALVAANVPELSVWNQKAHKRYMRAISQPTAYAAA